MSTERLLEIKEKIEKAKSRQSEIKGQISGVKTQMKNQFGVSDLKTAEKKLMELGNRLDKMEEKFKDRMEKLEEAYDWDEGQTVRPR